MRELFEPDSRVQLLADEPVKIAEAFVANKATYEGTRTIYRWEQEYWRWKESVISMTPADASSR